MKEFKDFNIAAPEQNFKGDKIKMSKILNKKITVYDYKIEDSKFEGERLKLQIKMDEKDHIVFTSSTFLKQMIAKVDKKDFPFATTIIEDNERFVFT
jgi:hypothetical protein